MFTDECGFRLMPLVHTTLAPRGHTPVLRHRARQRDKVSVAAAVTVSPAGGRLGLHFQTFPDAYIDGEAYAWFLRAVARQVRGPLVLLHDGGGMHKGPAVRAVEHDLPRLSLHRLPPYAPELNPVEGVWNHSRDKDLSNFVPADVPQLDGAVRRCLEATSHDQHQLRSCLFATPLSWRGLTGLI